MSTSRNYTPPRNHWLYRILSIFVVCHFLLVGVSYASNWRRSTLSDAILTTTQPYLIGLGLGVEMHSFEWTRAPQLEQPVRILVSHSSSSEPSIILMDSQASGLDRFKKRQLLQFIVTFIEMYNEENATRLLSSIIANAHVVTDKPFDFVVVEQQTDQHGNYEPLYQAFVVREPGVPPKFLPVLESQRTMKGISDSFSENHAPIGRQLTNSFENRASLSQEVKHDAID